MDHKFNEINLLNIWQAEHEVLKGKLVASDNLQEALSHPFSEVRDLVITKNIQYSPAVMVFICVEGYVDLEVDFKRYRLAAGDALTITHKQMGELHDMSDDIRFLLVAIDDSFYDPNINDTDPNRNLLLLKETPFIHLSETVLNESIAIYQILKRKLYEPFYLYQIETLRGLIHTFFYNIFAELAKQTASLPSGESSPEGHRQKAIFTEFMRAVGEHYAKERNIKFYADKLCITPKYLSQIIYQVSGRFAGDYIRDYVIREAKALIRGKRYSMLDISLMLNFSTQSSFTRFFKQATGLSPLEYQNGRQGKG